MSHSNGKITAPINLDGDVYATLGIGSVNGAYDLGYACANTHGNKPVGTVQTCTLRKPCTWTK